MKSLRNTPLVLSALLFSFICTGSVARAADDSTGTTQGQVTTESHNSDRFFRRIMAEAAYSNVGFQGDNTSRYSQPNGYTAGILLDIIGTGNWVMELGALYRQFGTNYNNGLGNNSFTANYISVPIDAKYYFSGQEGTSLYIKAGAMGSTLTSNNTLYATPTTQVGARQWETAFLGGVGCKIGLNDTTDLLIEGDYSRSIDSVFDGSNVYRSDISAGAGVSVNL